MDCAVDDEGSHVILEEEHWAVSQEIQVLADLNLNSRTSQILHYWSPRDIPSLAHDSSRSSKGHVRETPTDLDSIKLWPLLFLCLWPNHLRVFLCKIQLLMPVLHPGMSNRDSLRQHFSELLA